MQAEQISPAVRTARYVGRVTAGVWGAAMDLGPGWSVDRINVGLHQLDFSPEGFAELGVAAGGLLIALGSGTGIVQALSGRQLDRPAVRLVFDGSSTRISHTRFDGLSAQRVVEIDLRMRHDAADVGRVEREIDYQAPDIVIVHCATQSWNEDLQWAATISRLVGSTPTIAAMTESTGSAWGASWAKSDLLEFYAAAPRPAADTPELNFDSSPTPEPEPGGAPPRYVNTVIREANGLSVKLGQALLSDVEYRLGIGIGSPRIDSLLRSSEDASFPDEVLRPRTRRVEVFVQPADRPGDKAQHAFLYLPERGPAFACAAADRLPPETQWNSLIHDKCGAEHRELAEFELARLATGGQVAVEATIYVGAAAVHQQRIELSEVGATAKVTYRLAGKFEALEELADRTASIAEGAECLTINRVGAGTFSFRLRDAQWNSQAVAVRTVLTDLHFRRDKKGYKIRYPKVDVPFDAYKKGLTRLAAAGCSLFNGLFPDSASRTLAPMLSREAKARGHPPLVQIARTAQRPFVVPWQIVYDLPMEHPEASIWVCPSVTDFGPGGGSWPPPAACPYSADHVAAEERDDEVAILCPWGFWGLAHLLEVPEPPPESRSLDHVISEGLEQPAVLVATGIGLDESSLENHLVSLRAAVNGFPPDSKGVITASRALREKLEPTTMDVVYFLCHAEDAGEVGDTSALSFADGTLTSNDIAKWTRKWPPGHWDGRRPLVVLNACHTAEIVQSTMNGFVSNFVTAGAAGVVGTETLIDQAVASTAMQRFLQEFATGQCVGEAIRSTRWELLGRGNLLGFAYTPYCASGLRLRPSSHDLRKS